MCVCRTATDLGSPVETSAMKEEDAICFVRSRCADVKRRRLALGDLRHRACAGRRQAATKKRTWHARVREAKRAAEHAACSLPAIPPSSAMRLSHVGSQHNARSAHEAIT